MCGISGIIDFSGKKIEPRRIKAMTDSLSHRGPDDEGQWCENNVGLGHRRLAILDLTCAAHQPMANEDNSLRIVFNGEIYNFRELKATLITLGHTFRSNSDTEVILHGYEEWGASLWEKLDGMFAIALWDCKKQELILVRDPFAIKPLYWSLRNNTIIFASEIKGILASGMIERNVNHNSLSHYLTYFYTPGPETIVKNVSHVKPGRVMIFDKKGLRKESRFWELKKEDSFKTVSLNDLLDMLRVECKEAVKKSLVSDVPVGLLLSGGLDSNIILHELLALNHSDMHTITLGSREASFDEAPTVRKAISRQNFKSHIIYIEDFDLVKFFDHMVYHQDSLSANVASLSEYLIVKTASKYVKVVLAGAGNDELFAGYSTYIADQIRPYYLMMPGCVKNLVKTWAHWLPQSERKYSFDYLLRKFTDGVEYSPQKSHYWWRTIFTDTEKRKLFTGSGDLRDVHSQDSFSLYQHYYDEAKDKFDPSTQNLYADFFLFCNENANMMVDNLSMAFSLETRPPFLTKRFVEFAFKVPYKFKLKKTTTKYCLRKAYRGSLPSCVLNKKKTGLVTPLSRLIRGPMREMVCDTFADLGAHPYFNKDYLNRILTQHMSRERDFGFHIYLIFTFMRWHTLFMKPCAQSERVGGVA